MYTRSMLALLFVLTLAATVRAQTKIVAEGACPKPDPQYTIEVGDRPEHVYQIGKVKCTYTKTFEMGGIAAASYEATYFSEITGKTGRTHGVVIGTMANGDTVHYAYQAEGTAEGGQSHWTITGGTGKFTGIKGKGTTKTKFAADGTATAVHEGTYKLPK